VRIAVIPGDGIGPEVTAQSLRVLEALRGYDFDFEAVELAAGAHAYEETGFSLPESTVRAALDSHAILFGAVGDARYDHLERHLRPEQAIVGLRQRLGLFASLRQVRVDPILAHLSPLRRDIAAQTDLMIVRELAGDVYMASPRGRRLAPDGIGKGEPEGFDTMRYSRPEVERIAHTAFKVARVRNKRLLSVDKANVLETSRLWREVISEISADYPDVQLSHMYADAAGMALVSSPTALDTVVAPNLFGDLLSDIASILTGSVALPATAMFGASGPYLFEPGHGSAMDIAGRDLANPLSSIRAMALMLHYAANRPDLAARVEEAIQCVLREGLRTADIHSHGTTRVGTRQMGDEIVRAIERG
jgi:3-isopropylmalate dehydrogenase